MIPARWPGPTKVVGLSGKARSGKDTLANFLVEDHGYTRVALADPMKEMLLALDPYVQVYARGVARVSGVVGTGGWEAAKEIPEIRRLLQRLGTEAGRDILGPNLWVNSMIDRACKVDGPVVVTDVRFTNEAEAIEKWGGKVVRVLRDVAPATGITVSAAAHASETEMDLFPFHYRVNNNGTLDDLRRAAEVLAR